jgi:hypothetical protein
LDLCRVELLAAVSTDAVLGEARAEDEVSAEERAGAHVVVVAADQARDLYLGFGEVDSGVLGVVVNEDGPILVANLVAIDVQRQITLRDLEHVDVRDLQRPRGARLRAAERSALHLRVGEQVDVGVQRL